MKLPAGLAVVLVVLSASVAAGAATNAAAACNAGTHKIGSVTYHVYCGPASASVKTAGKSFSFRHGSCVRTGVAKVFTMSIGKLSTSGGKARYSYFGVTVPNGNHDGTYRRGVITWASRGKRHAVTSLTLRLTHHQTRGSFSGRVAGTNDTVSGSFRCK